MARLLIIDDEPDIAMIAKRMLKKAGHETYEVETAAAGIAKLKKEEFDLILLDVVMLGGINGWEMCKKLKADSKTRGTPVVMFTVRTAPSDVKMGKECGADAQVDKPFGAADLLGTVEKVLQNS